MFLAACGDGQAEERASSHFSIPFKRIQTVADLYEVPGLLSESLAMPVPVIVSATDVLSANADSSLSSDIKKESSTTQVEPKNVGKILENCRQELSSYSIKDSSMGSWKVFDGKFIRD